MATFKKPNNVKYTDMCKYIDDNVYNEKIDDVKIYEYLYHIVNMLAHQGGYFKNAQYYDDFAMAGATRVFLRLRNPKQFEVNEQGEPVLKPIKSVLNYIKSIIYPMKVVFEQENYAQTKPYDPESDELSYDFTNDFRENLSESIDGLELVEFELYLSDISKTTRALIESIPKSKYDAEWLNIYTSVILSLLNSITLNNKNKEKLKTLREVICQKPEIIEKIYKEERKDCIMLYHLDEKYRGYVTVLLNRVRHLIAKDLSTSSRTYIPSEINAKNLLMSSLDEEDFTNQ